jgi:hypothetical protein
MVISSILRPSSCLNCFPNSEFRTRDKCHFDRPVDSEICFPRKPAAIIRSASLCSSESFLG